MTHKALDDLAVRRLMLGPWFPASLATASRVRVRDTAILGVPPHAVRFLIVEATTRGSPGLYLQTLIEGPGRSPASPAAHAAGTFDQAVLGALLRGRHIATELGGAIVVDGAALPDQGLGARLPFDPGFSSNTVTVVDFGGRACVHKLFRCLDAGSHEVMLLRLMRGRSAAVPRYVASYHYQDAATGVAYPLGVLYEFIEGNGLDLPLRDNLRALWRWLDLRPRAVGAQLDRRAVRAHALRLRPVLVAVGRQLRAFHGDLACVLEASERNDRLDVAGLAVPAKRTGDAVLRWLDSDLTRPRALLDTAIETLARELDWLSGEPAVSVAAVPVRAGPCHGDLHLSHVLLGSAPDRAWPVSFIDLSTPSIDPGAADFRRQSPWQDLVALERALEYFTADETSAWLVARSGGTPEEVARATLLAAARIPDSSMTPSGRWSGRHRRLLRVERVARLWRDEVLRAILDGYRHGDPRRPSGGDDLAGWATGPVRRLLYLARLLHELDYDAEHGRAAYADLNLHELLRFAGDRRRSRRARG
jgi:1-epi-valienol-7-phosphate kinase